MLKPEILIVDDRMENIISMEEILEDMNVSIVTASSGNEAVAKSMEKEFALILMDVQMPEMDGFEAMKLIHSEHTNKETPVIFLSAIYSDDYYKIKGIQEGAVDFMTKPIVEGILIGKINVFLTMYRQKIKLREQMNQIASLNRNMESFNRILVHDLKQPLNGVMGMSEILLSMENVPDHMKELLEHIYNSGKNMNDLINDVLDLIRTQNEEGEIEEVDMNAVIEEIRSLYGGKTAKKLEIAYSNLPHLKTRKSLINSIFRNLIGNSIKYNDNDVIKISVSYRKNDGNHEFCTADNGIGIQPEKFKEIFYPFVRANNNSKYSGTGIGLSIVQSAVENLSGSIGVASSGEQGTTICMVILDAVEEKE